MIPIRDTTRSANVPVVNYLIIGINVLAFLWEMSLGPRLEAAFFQYGMVPLRYSDPLLASRFSAWEQGLPFITSMFLHGGLLHLIGNMWSLFIFGDNVEDRMGHARYLLFYLACGLAAGLAHLFTNFDSRIPTIGASGAISGVMGAYLLLYPRARILTVIPIFFFLQFVEIPAFVFLGLWFLMQILSAGATSGQAGGVAWWAHIGGFLAGMVFLKLVLAIPRAGLDEGMRRRTKRRSTHRFQSLSRGLPARDLDVEGWISVTPGEARHGARKLISVPQGFRQKTVMVHVPPGSRDGTRLRLAGLGKRDAEGQAGDLYLEVRVRE
jgi:membrane associated rhomboid family serine protease